MEPTKKDHPAADEQSRSQAANGQANDASLPSDGPVSQSETSDNADLEQTNKPEEQEQNGGDLAANALGNEANDERD